MVDKMSKYLVFVYSNGNVGKRMFTNYNQAFDYALEQNRNFNNMVRLLRFNNDLQKWESDVVIYARECS